MAKEPTSLIESAMPSQGMPLGLQSVSREYEHQIVGFFDILLYNGAFHLFRQGGQSY